MDANLTGAKLAGANLKNADLQKVNLTNADLAGADLQMANFTDANLQGVNWAFAKGIEDATFGDEQTKQQVLNLKAQQERETKSTTKTREYKQGARPWH